MYISEKLKKNSIAEYLLYMWQVEDTIRAYEFDIERITDEYLSRFEYDDEQMEEVRGWYEQLCYLMIEEQICDAGHLQINKNIILMLTDLHLQILQSPKFPFYSAQYYKVLPYIVELRKKGGNKGEIETCFDAMYGVMLFRAQKKNISPETAVAIDNIVKLIGTLSDYYKKDKDGELEL